MCPTSHRDFVGKAAWFSRKSSVIEFAFCIKTMKRGVQKRRKSDKGNNKYSKQHPRFALLNHDSEPIFL